MARERIPAAAFAAGLARPPAAKCPLWAACPAAHCKQAGLGGSHADVGKAGDEAACGQPVPYGARLGTAPSAARPIPGGSDTLDGNLCLPGFRRPRMHTGIAIPGRIRGSAVARPTNLHGNLPGHSGASCGLYNSVKSA